MVQSSEWMIVNDSLGLPFFCGDNNQPYNFRTQNQRGVRCCGNISTFKIKGFGYWHCHSANFDIRAQHGAAMHDVADSQGSSKNAKR